MEEMDIKHELHLLQKEVEAAVSLTEDTKLNLVSAIDALKIEVETLRRFMARLHPEFDRFYPKLREEVIQEVDPEWMERGAGRKQT